MIWGKQGTWNALVCFVRLTVLTGIQTQTLNKLNLFLPADLNLPPFIHWPNRMLLIKNYLRFFHHAHVYHAYHALQSPPSYLVVLGSRAFLVLQYDPVKVFTQCIYSVKLVCKFISAIHHNINVLLNIHHGKNTYMHVNGTEFDDNTD